LSERAALYPAFTADLAALEWARLQALLAPDPPTLANIEDIDPELFPSAHAELIAHLHVLTLPRGALELWIGTNDRKPFSDHGIHMEQVAIAVWRRDFEVRHISLSDCEAAALAQARAGASMQDVCSTLGGPNASADRAFRILSTWFSRKWMVAITAGK
jgi:hypothetical protein